jgi:HK97 family phage prohead protease
VIEHKRARLLEIKTDDGQPGEFKALVSVFGNVDSGGDRVVKGAFADDLKTTGGIYPVVWSHEWNTVPIGVTKSAVETNRGLEIHGALLVDDHPVAKQVYAAFKAGVPMEFSFGYDVTGSRFVEEDGKKIRELTGIKALEVGPCLIGMNRETELLAVKSFAKDIANQITTGAAHSEPAPSSEPDPAPSDPVDAGSSPTDDAGQEPVLIGADRAAAARYLATPVN